MHQATVVGFSWANKYGKVEVGKRGYTLLSTVIASNDYSKFYMRLKRSCQQVNGSCFVQKMFSGSL